MLEKFKKLNKLKKHIKFADDIIREDSKESQGETVGEFRGIPRKV